MNMSIDIFGMDLLFGDNIYGVWLFTAKDWEESHRSLLLMCYSERIFRLDLLWFRVI